MATELGSLAPGSIIKIPNANMINNPTDYYVAHHDYPVAGNGLTLICTRYSSLSSKWDIRMSGYTNAYTTSNFDTVFSGTFDTNSNTSIPLNYKVFVPFVDIPYTPGNGDYSVTTLKRQAFLPSLTELGFTPSNNSYASYGNVEGFILDAAELLKPITDASGTTNMQWTRTPRINNTTEVMRVQSGGVNCGPITVTAQYFGRMCFCLPSNVIIDDNMQPIIPNQPPTTPGIPKFPDTIYAGSLIPVMWTPSNDAEGDPIRYSVDKWMVVNGATVFGHYYENGDYVTTKNFIVDTVPEGVTEIKYVVYSYDGQFSYTPGESEFKPVISHTGTTIAVGDLSVGNIVHIQEKGVKVPYYVAHHNYPTYNNGLTLLARMCWYENRITGNTNSYSGSQIDNICNNINYTDDNFIGKYSAYIRELIQNVDIPFTPGNGNWNLTTLTRKVFILSATELGASATTTFNYEGGMVALANTLATLLDVNGIDTEYQWTRTPYKNNNQYMIIKTGAGSGGSIGRSSESYGYRPCFCLPSDTLISLFDGTIGDDEWQSAIPAPSYITVPSDNLIEGKSYAVLWGPSPPAENEDAIAGYRLQRSTDDAATWTQIYQGTDLSYLDALPIGTRNVTYRVAAYNATGFMSSWTSHLTRMVLANNPPQVNGDEFDSDQIRVEGWSWNYIVTDAESDTILVTEYYGVEGGNETIIRTYTTETGINNVLTITDDIFITIPNDQNCYFGVRVTDSIYPWQQSLQFGFCKSVHALSIELSEPMPADDVISRVAMVISGYIPSDADFKILVTNNAKDVSPVWEDATATIVNKYAYLFTNTIATNGFAFNFRVSASRGLSGTGGYIIAIGGGFE